MKIPFAAQQKDFSELPDEAPAAEHVTEIFPQPSAGEATLLIHDDQSLKSEIEIFNVFGECVKVISLSRDDAGNVSLDLRYLDSGAYFIHYHSATADDVLKFIKQ